MSESSAIAMNAKAGNISPRSGSKLKGEWIVGLVSMLALIGGWQIRDEYLIHPDRGLGYALGIIGGSAMLLLLIYPLRKRLPRTPFLILSTPAWFKLHMILGIAGPILIFYHSNFGLGSTNANVALFSMITMVTSGLVGRFIYSKIHLGLYGNKAHLRDLLAAQGEAANELLAQSNLGENNETTRLIREEIAFLSEALNGAKGSLNPVRILSLDFKLGRRKRLIKRQMLQIKHAQEKIVLQNLTKSLFQCYELTSKISGLAFYDKLFSAWHMMHLPIFFTLILAGFIHVYAVHTY